MVNGPPTPPPTTDIEIQDATKDAEPTSSASTSTSTDAELQPVPEQSQPNQTAPQTQQLDIYQTAFTSSIAPLATAKQWDALAQTAELADLLGNDMPSRMLIVAPLVLAYLIKDELPAAKFALSRLSARMQRLPIVTSLSRLLQSVTERHHREVYERANEIPKDGDLNGIAYPEFATVVAAMVDAFYESFRTRTFLLLSKAYSEIPLSLAQNYLGMPVEALLAAAEAQGWKFDANTQTLSPVVSVQKTVSFDSSSLSSFDFVSNSVSRLEMSAL